MEKLKNFFVKLTIIIVYGIFILLFVAAFIAAFTILPIWIFDIMVGMTP